MKAAIVSKISPEKLENLKTTYTNVEWIDVSSDREKLAELGPEIEIVYGNVRKFELPKLTG